MLRTAGLDHREPT